MTWIGWAAHGATRLGGDSYQAAELPGTAQTEAPGQLRATATPGPDKGYYCQLLAAAGWTSLPSPLVCQPC